MRLSHHSYEALLWVLVSAAHADYISPLRYAAVVKRQGCPSDYFSCASQGAAFAGTCCADGQLCALDAYSSPACCPSSAVCTGVAPTSTGTGAAGTATTATSVSYVSNQYFIFPAIATSFANSGACLSAASECSTNYQICTSELASYTGGYGVTVVVPGATTIEPTPTTLPIASATSMCASLSSEACHGLQSSQCTQTGTSAGFIVGTTNAAPRPTAACMRRLAAVVGLGIMGAQL